MDIGIRVRLGDIVHASGLLSARVEAVSFPLRIFSIIAQAPGRGNRSAALFPLYTGLRIGRGTRCPVEKIFDLC